MSKIIFSIIAIFFSVLPHSTAEAQCPEKCIVRRVMDNIQMRRVERQNKSLRSGRCRTRPICVQRARSSSATSGSVCAPIAQHRQFFPVPSPSVFVMSNASRHIPFGAPVTRVVSETRTKQVSVPFQERVTQNYTVQVPQVFDGTTMDGGVIIDGGASFGAPVDGGIYVQESLPLSVPVNGGEVSSISDSRKTVKMDLAAMRAVIIAKSEDAINAIYGVDAVSYTHLTLPTICSV